MPQSITRKEKKPVQKQHKRRIKTKKGIQKITINPGFKKPTKAEIYSPRVKTCLPSNIIKERPGVTPKLRSVPKAPSAKDREAKIEFQKKNPEIDFDVFESFVQKSGFSGVGKPMSGYKYPIQKGFLSKYIPMLDQLTNKRWLFWGQAMLNNKIPLKIPKIKFLGAPDPEVMKMLKRNVDFRIAKGTTAYKAVEELFDWILYGIGDPSVKTPPDIDERTNEFWYRNVDLGIMMANPHDYPARLLEHYGVRGGPGWFATPMAVTTMMADITAAGKNQPWARSNDPCAGTGSMILPLSNYSLNITAQDISLTVLRGLRINAWLYVPWIVKPFPKYMLDDLKKRIEGKNSI